MRWRRIVGADPFQLQRLKRSGLALELFSHARQKPALLDEHFIQLVHLPLQMHDACFQTLQPLLRLLAHGFRRTNFLCWAKTLRSDCEAESCSACNSS